MFLYLTMKKILLVDDERSFVTALQKILTLKGYDVEIAFNGLEAIEAIKTKTPDILVTDVLMPVMDGLEVIMFSKKNFPDVKVIAISGGGRVSAKDYLETAKIWKADEILSKPFSAKDLLKIIENILTGNP